MPFGLPIMLKLTEGQAHDGRSAADMLGRLGEGDILLADRAYDSDAMRANLAERGAWACVKPVLERDGRRLNRYLALARGSAAPPIWRCRWR